MSQLEIKKELQALAEEQLNFAMRIERLAARIEEHPAPLVGFGLPASVGRIESKPLQMKLNPETMQMLTDTGEKPKACGLQRDLLVALWGSPSLSRQTIGLKLAAYDRTGINQTLSHGVNKGLLHSERTHGNRYYGLTKEGVEAARFFVNHPGRLQGPRRSRKEEQEANRGE